MSKESSNIWMPLYIGDYLGDTMHLSTIEHGAYLLLLMAYWKNRGPIEEKTIPVICRMSLSEFQAIRSAIEPFFQLEGSKWRNKRADAEIERWQYFKEDKEFGAAISNLKRYGTPIPEKFAERYAERSDVRTPPPSPSPLPTSELKTNGDFEVFKEAMLAYPGRVNGRKAEWENFKRKNTDYKKILPKLLPAIQAEIEHKKRSRAISKFTPEWANFQTWINNGRWEQLLEELPEVKTGFASHL